MPGCWRASSPVPARRADRPGGTGTVPDWAEIRRSLHGAWRLAHGDAGAMAAFDTSADGFYRSFGVWAFVLPVQVLLYLAISTRAPGENALALAAAEALLSATAWLLYALGAALLLRQAGRERAFAGFMTAYNWAQALLILVFVPLILLLAMGGLDSALSQLLYWLLQILVILYIGFIARAATGGGLALCLGLALLDQIVFRLVFALGQDLLLGA